MNTFREAVCRKAGIQHEAFPGWMLARAMYPHARLFYGMLSSLLRDYGYPDRDLITRISGATDLQRVRSEIDLYRTDSVNNGFWRGTLKIRLSSRRLFDLARDQFPNVPEVEPFADTRAPL